MSVLQNGLAPVMIPTACISSVIVSAGSVTQEPAPDTVFVMFSPAGIQDINPWGVLLVVAALVSTIALLAFLWRLDRQGHQIAEIARRLEKESRPVFERAAAVVDNLEAITRLARDEVEHVAGSVRSLSERSRQVAAHLETRIDDLNALLEVVQGEAEQAFVTAASTLRGVRAGTDALEGRRALASYVPAQESGAPVDGSEQGGPRPSEDE